MLCYFLENVVAIAILGMRNNTDAFKHCSSRGFNDLALSLPLLRKLALQHIFSDIYVHSGLMSSLSHVVSAFAISLRRAQTYWAHSQAMNGDILMRL